MKVKVKSNLDRVMKNLDDIKEKSMLISSESILRYGEMAKAELREDITRKGIVDTGRLRRSVEAEYKGNYRVTVTSEAIDPNNKVDYAPFQEYGTRHITPRPYFYSTLRRFSGEFRRYLSKISRKIFR